jgi:N-acetylglucosaminyldiphosphoundecaprenol N-acetyl-beta-D-mannosaminyltransferase
LIARHEIAWVLGLPVDCVNLQRAQVMVRDAARDRSSLVFATPNLNFLVQTAKDPGFRDAVLRCSLSLPDGMPVVWIARALGASVHERVAGSDLFECLVKDRRSKPLRTFFFGGPEGAARQSHARYSGGQCGIVSAGWLYPDFGSIQSMSTAAILDHINESGADFLVIALGASKGHQWLELNRLRLNVPVMSHLGAVINFAAGTIRRAPRFAQRFGLEWLWRIREEPSLWKRYAGDGVELARLLLVNVAPLVLYRLYRSCRYSLSGKPRIEITSRPGQVVVKGSLVRGTSEQFIREIARQAVSANAGIDVNVENVHALDSVGLGALYAAAYRGIDGRRVKIVGRPKCWSLVTSHRATILFDP